jgi:type IV secretory pathway VirB2 component (pilin)
MNKSFSIIKRPSLGQAALKLRATLQLDFLRTGLWLIGIMLSFGAQNNLKKLVPR